MSNLNNRDIEKWCKDAIANGGRNGRLEWATANGFTETVVTIIEQNNIDINEEHGDERYTLLHIAAINDYPDTANALIKKGANPNAQDKDERTPLHCAIDLHRSAEMIRSLIKGKANVNVKDKDGKTPFDLTTDEEIKALLKNAGDIQPGSGIIQEEEEEEQVTEAKSESNITKQEADKTVSSGSETPPQTQQKGQPTTSAGEEPDVETEGVKSVAPTEPAQTEEQPSSFFGSLFSMLMKPFSLIGSFFSGVFSWLLGSDEPASQSDANVSLVESNSLDEDNPYNAMRSQDGE